MERPHTRAGSGGEAPPPPATEPSAAQRPSRLRRALLTYPASTAALQVLAGLVKGAFSLADVHLDASMLALLAVLMVPVVVHTVARRMLVELFVGSLVLAFGAAVVAGVAMTGAGASDASAYVMTLAGLAFIAAGCAWGLWCATNILADD